VFVANPTSHDANPITIATTTVFSCQHFALILEPVAELLTPSAKLLIAANYGRKRPAVIDRRYS